MQKPSALFGKAAGGTAGRGRSLVPAQVAARGQWQLWETARVVCGSLPESIPANCNLGVLCEIMMRQNASFIRFITALLAFSLLLSKLIWNPSVEKHCVSPHAKRWNGSDCYISWWLLLFFSLQHRLGEEQRMKMKWRSWLLGLHRSMGFLFHWTLQCKCKEL